MEEVRANPNPVETPYLPLVLNPFEFEVEGDASLLPLAAKEGLCMEPYT